MISQRRLFPSLLIVLLMSLFLAGCVRPAPEGEATAVPAEPDTSDPNIGGGTVLDPTAVPNVEAPAYPAETVSEPEAVAEADAAYPASEDTMPEEEVVDAEQPAEETAAAPPASDSPEQPAPETAVTPEAVAATASCPTEHVVQPGENLFRIGLQYSLSWVTLAQYNGITNPNSITAGQTLNVPCAGAPPNQPTPPPDGVITYIVQPGDNLFRIGLKFGVSWVEIAEANGLVNPNQVYAGQVLKIPTSAPGPRPEFTHVVKQGETIYSISVQYGVPAAAIADANNLQSPYVIYAGQTLVIPGNG